MNPTLEKLAAAWERMKKPPTVIVLPKYRAALHDLTIELYASQRKLPMLAGADALIVPVGPDLRMVTGVAKMARDRGADIVQHEALRAAPLEPGNAFIGTGARYRYKYTALAIIFDNAKRPTQQAIHSAIIASIVGIRERGGKSAVIADMTENLLAQPNWITVEQRRATAAVTAKIMVDAIVASGKNLSTIKIWCSEPDNAQFFITELKRVHDRERTSLSAHA